MSDDILTHHIHRNRLVRIVRARPRLMIGLAVGLALFVLMSFATTWRLPTQLLIAWNCAVGIYIVSGIHLCFQASMDHIKLRARLQDEGSAVVLALTVIAATASITAIFAELAGVKDLTSIDRGIHIGLAALTIMMSWAFIHMMFAFHYAHDYFNAKAKGQDGGLDFPGTKPLSYADFLYFAFIIGTSGQTADVAFTSTDMRMNGLIHCVLSFAFNTTILALTINIAASLI